MMSSDDASWSTQRVVDARSGRTLNLLYLAAEPQWPERMGAQAVATWARLELFHRGHGTEVYRGHPAPGAGLHYVKSFTPRTPGDRWKYLLRGPRALLAWRHARQAESLGFRVVRPVCVLSERRGVAAPCDVLVTREEPEAVPARDRLRQRGSTTRRRKLLEALGREVARWHDAGLLHSDLNLGNLLVHDAGGQPVFIWLDVEGNRHLPMGVPLNRRAKNLTDLNQEPQGLSRTDRMRVWQAYREAARLSPGPADRLLRSVIRMTSARWRRRGWIP